MSGRQPSSMMSFDNETTFSKLPKEIRLVICTVAVKSGRQKTSPLLALPKELRLAIYEQVFTTDSTVVIGERDLRNQLLTGGPPVPGILHTCSLIRSEALPVYFANTHFVLNVQRMLCQYDVLEWIRRCSIAYPEEFQRINLVSIVAGSGIRQPPQQYEFRIRQNLLYSVSNRRTWQPYTLPPERWHPPLWDVVRQHLQMMPKKGESDFDVPQNIRQLIDVLTK